MFFFWNNPLRNLDADTPAAPTSTHPSPSVAPISGIPQNSGAEKYSLANVPTNAAGEREPPITLTAMVDEAASSTIAAERMDDGEPVSKRRGNIIPLRQAPLSSSGGSASKPATTGLANSNGNGGKREASSAAGLSDANAPGASNRPPLELILSGASEGEDEALIEAEREEWEDEEQRWREKRRQAQERKQRTYDAEPIMTFASARTVAEGFLVASRSGHVIFKRAGVVIRGSGDDDFDK